MKRVVITGLGAITPIGNNVYDFWESLVAGKCGISNIESLEKNGSEVKVAAQVKNYNKLDYFTPLASKKIDRFTQFALISCEEAIKDAHLENLQDEQASIIFGSGLGGETIGGEYHNLVTNGLKSVAAMTMPSNLINMAAANIAIKYKIKGQVLCLSTACATGTDCIGQAYKEIKHGYSDIVITGASDVGVNPISMAGFEKINALTKEENPLRASIPFDKERSGFVMGEGAGTLILEELEHAKKRNAKIYAEVVGYGASCDAYNITMPDPNLTEGIKAVEDAINDANIFPKDIDYINAHGTSTKYNDKFESAIYSKVFSAENPMVHISSTKSSTGHLLGATGAIEAIVCVKAIENSFIPATIGHKVKDEELNLNYVLNEGIKKNIIYALSNNCGFGGHNATIIFKKYI